MNLIVPLAGPDIYNERYGIKPFIEIEGQPLITRALESRSWYSKNHNLLFALKEHQKLHELKKGLKGFFPQSQFVVMENYTKGALLSALAASSLIQNYDNPVVIDLADILFESTINITDTFKDETVGALLPLFQSNHEGYSYAEIQEGRITKAREKKLISSNASAGVYIFRNFATFLDGVSHSLRNAKELSFKDNLFLCPAINGVIESGLKVLPTEVKFTKSVSLYIKSFQVT